jgi:hypothetical protein
VVTLKFLNFLKKLLVYIFLLMVVVDMEMENLNLGVLG